MNKFLEFVFIKKRKILTSLCIGFVILGIIAPETTQAVVIPVLGSWLLKKYGAAKTADIAIKSGLALAYYIALIPLIISAVLNFLAAVFLKWIISIGNTLSFTNNQAVNLGWPIVRDFANILIVLAFIAVALATILRYRNWQAKELLAKLIIVALLINFSLVICGLFIDISNVTMNFFLTGGGVGSGIDQFAKFDTASFGAISDIVKIETTLDNFPVKFALVTGNTFYNLISSLILFLYFFLFLFRMVALWILVILSPIAFVAYVFPGAQRVWSMWWHNFLQWCIIGIFGAFFLYIGQTLMVSMNKANPEILLPNTSHIPGATPDFLQTAFGSFMPIFITIIPGFILVLGFMFSLQSSAMGAGTAMSIGRWGRNKMTGSLKATGKWAAKFAADNTGATRAKNGTTDYVSQKLENWGFLSRGTTAANKKKRVGAELNEKGRMTRADALSDAEIVEELKKPRLLGGSREGQLDRAAMLKTLEERGKLNLLTDDEQMEILDKNTLYGIKPHELVRKMSTKNQIEIVRNKKYNARTREEAMKALAAKGQLNSSIPGALTLDETTKAMEEMSKNGVDLRSVIQDMQGRDLAQILTNNQESVAAGNPQILDPYTRGLILKALADKGELDSIGKIGETIAVRRKRKIDAVLEGAANGILPQDIVRKMNSDDKAEVLNDPDLLLNHLSNDQQRLAVIGKTTESLMRRNELNLIDAGPFGAHREEIYEASIRSGVTDVEDLEEKDFRAGALNVRRLIRIGNSLGVSESTINEGLAALATPSGSRTAAQNASVAAIETTQRAARRQVLGENIERMNGDKLRDIDPLYLNGPEAYPMVSRLNPKQVGEFASADLASRSALKTHLSQIQEDIENATNGYKQGTNAAYRAANAPNSVIDMREAGRLARLHTAIDNLP